MADKFKRAVEYRMLLAKTQDLRIPLTIEEEARLVRLRQQLPAPVPALDDRDPYTMLSEPLHADVVYSGRFDTGSVRNVSGSGMALSMATPPALGQRLLIHVRDPRYPVQYTLPVQVVSRVVKGHTGISVAFDGLPTQSAIAGRTSGVFSAEEDAPTAVGRRRTSA